MSVEGCVACSGSRALSFIFPVVFLVFALGLGIYLCRSGRAKALAKLLNQCLQEKHGDESIIEDGLQQYFNDRVQKWVTASVASRALEMVSQHAEALMSLLAIVMPKLPLSLLSARAHRRRCRHQRHLPRQRTQGRSTSRGQRLSRLIRQKSILRRSTRAAARRGCTPKPCRQRTDKIPHHRLARQVLGQPALSSPSPTRTLLGPHLDPWRLQPGLS